MDGKAKNIYFSRKEGGGGSSGVRDMDPALTGNFFYSHILRPILHKSAVVLSLDNKLKCLIPIIFLLCPLSKMHVPKKESCIYSTGQK